MTGLKLQGQTSAKIRCAHILIIARVSVKRNFARKGDFMANPTSLPLLITSALSLLREFVFSPAVLFGRPGESAKKMRSDRAENMLAVLEVLVRSCCLQHGGLICHIAARWVRPKTVIEIAMLTKLSEKTVDRCLSDLTAMGYLESKQVKRKNRTTGQIEVSGALRQLTQKFWAALHLWRLFKDSCEWAKNNGRRAFVMPFKGISYKAKTTCKAVGDLAKPLLTALSEDAQRAKCWCEKIQNMLHQNK